MIAFTDRKSRDVWSRGRNPQLEATNSEQQPCSDLIGHLRIPGLPYGGFIFNSITNITGEAQDGEARQHARSFSQNCMDLCTVVHWYT